MSGFIFPLRGLLHYRRSRRDLCRQLLVQILADDSRLAEESGRLVREREQQFAEFREISRRRTVVVDAAAMRRYHSIQLTGQMAGVDEKRALVGQQLRFCREALTKADADVKVLERLEEKQLAVFRYGLERREQHEREDAWMARRIQETAR